MKPTVGAAVLNYRRPENVPLVIQALRQQTIVPRIVLWNNGDGNSFSDVDWEIDSSLNAGCITRWHAMAMLQTDYVLCIDDDLLPKDPELVRNCINACRAHGDHRIIGYVGKTLGPGPRFYRDGVAKKAKPDRDQFVDVIKGRFMFLPTKILERVPIVFPSYQGRGDDIWISLLTGTSPEHHVLARCTSGAFEELPELDAALAKNRDHSLKRDIVVSKLIEQKKVHWRKPTPFTKFKSLMLAGAYRLRGYRDHRVS